MTWTRVGFIVLGGIAAGAVIGIVAAILIEPLLPGDRRRSAHRPKGRP